MYRTIHREPLGIRKVDYQADRRAYRRSMWDRAVRMFEYWTSNRQQGLSDKEICRLVEVAFEMGWEDGVKVGVARTKDRVKESLDNGRLVKTR
jgi:hypothetical protein